ncbi:MAG: hypothetical protein JKY56_04895 [Kofleriaceae bacterium]|nr:hypothetical protein [Kofleriaceae bacterium]
MVRWLRIVALGALIVSLLALGIGIGLFLWANRGWTPVTVPPWLTSLFGNPELELWIPALIAGWLVSLFAIVALVVWSMFYVWRRRQYEALISKLERELTELRNLPFTAPAPLEDLPELPDVEAAEVLAFGEERGSMGYSS